MSRYARFVVIWALVVAALAAQPVMAAASRSISAAATCGVGDGGKPIVSVEVANHAGAALVVSFLRGFTTPQAFTVRLRPVEPPIFKAVTIASGQTAKLSAPWDDLRSGDGDSGGALVVTNFGVLAPVCGASSPETVTLGSAPSSRAAAKLEAVKIAATSLGQLESWRAYPALYALLHPDVRAEVSFGVIACWYAAQFGTAVTPSAAGVISTSIDGVSFGGWTWTLNNRRYADAATVKVTQQIGNATLTQPVTSTEHLVLADGQWRWFFGTSRASLAAMTGNCPLDTAAAPAAVAATPTPKPAKTPRPTSTPTAAAAELGSITVTNYVCPTGMTLRNLVRAGCSPEPSAARWTLTGKPIKGLRTWSETTERGGLGHAWTDLPFGEYVLNPAALPTGVTLYAIGGSDNIARQDKGIAVTLGPGEPNIQLNTYLIAPATATATPSS